MTKYRCLRTITSIAAVILAGMLTRASVFAQSTATELKVTPNSSAASFVSSMRYHILPISRAAVVSRGIISLTGPEPFSELSLSGVKSFASVPKPGFFPAALSYFGGNVVTTATAINIYVGSPNEAPWGTPEEFQTSLGKSRMIHIADQYVKSTKANRYTLGAPLTIATVGSVCTSPTLCSALNVLNIADSAALFVGAAGYNHIFHVFLPPGVDTCMSDGTTCYSPDNLSTWVFCGYHSSFTGALGETLFTVEPFQNVNAPGVGGCQVSVGTPNGQLIDSTNSVLSHETFETISDPDPGSGWVAASSRAQFGQEMADICAGLFDANTDVIVPTVKLYKTLYAIQAEYSNKYQACSTSP
jgi:hypothetical protein